MVGGWEGVETGCPDPGFVPEKYGVSEGEVDPAFVRETYRANEGVAECR